MSTQTNNPIIINFDSMSVPPPRNYFLSLDTLKTVYKGALGAMSFGAYHQFTSNKIMELNNKVNDSKMKNNNLIYDSKMKKIETENAALRTQLAEINSKIANHY